MAEKFGCFSLKGEDQESGRAISEFDYEHLSTKGAGTSEKEEESAGSSSAVQSTPGSKEEEQTSATPAVSRRNTRRDVRHESHGELVRLASKGDQAAWDELVHRFASLVRRTAVRNGLNHSDAADVVQVTWIHLIQHLDQLRDPERLPAWLATTARRESIRLAINRTRQVCCADPLREHGQDRGAVAADVYRVELDDEPAVHAALDRLPPRYGQLLRLWMSDAGLTYTQIAERLGIPVGSIGPMRLRSLRILRRDPELAATV